MLILVEKQGNGRARVGTCAAGTDTGAERVTDRSTRQGQRAGEVVNARWVVRVIFEAWQGKGKEERTRCCKAKRKIV